MLPDNVLSSSPVNDDFLPHYQGKQTPDRDLCRAGIALNDGSQGLDVQLWLARLYPTGLVTVASEGAGYSDETDIVTRPGTTRISLAFDNNMQVILAGQDKEGGWLYWYDPVVAGYTLLQYPGARTPFVRIDDIRDSSNATRDVILSYISSSENLCVRNIRDRFTVEYILKAVHNWQVIYQCGMNKKLRFQYALVWDPDRISRC